MPYDHAPRTQGGHIEIVEEHNHSVARVYPNLAAAVTVTGDAVAWTLGGAATVVAANAITSDFDIHHIYISNISANDNYQLELYDDGDLILQICFTKSATADPVRQINTMSPMIRKNSAITAKLASAGGGSDTVDVKIGYHTY